MPSRKLIRRVGCGEESNGNAERGNWLQGHGSEMRYGLAEPQPDSGLERNRAVDCALSTGISMVTMWTLEYGAQRVHLAPPSY